MRGPVWISAVARDLSRIVDGSSGIERPSRADWQHRIQINHAITRSVQERTLLSCACSGNSHHLSGAVDAVTKAITAAGKSSEVGHASTGTVEECVIITAACRSESGNLRRIVDV